MYIGNTVITQGFTPQVDFFSGNASTTAFTLSRPVASTYQMIVVVANVTQNPGSAYTVSGNTITFSSAPPTGTNNIWVEYTSLITQTIAPSPGTVGAAQLPQSQILTAIQQPTGSVVQVAQGTSSTQISTTSSSFVTTGLTTSITPLFSASKILVLVSLPTQNASGTTAFFTIYRNSTNLGLGTYSALSQTIAASSTLYTNQSMIYLDSPSTTSSTTYTAYMSAFASQTIYAMQNNVGGTITLMEIR